MCSALANGRSPVPAFASPPPTATAGGWTWAGKLAPGLNWCAAKDVFGAGGWKAWSAEKAAGGPGFGIRPFPAPGPDSKPRLAPILGCNFPRGVAFAPVAIVAVRKCGSVWGKWLQKYEFCLIVDKEESTAYAAVKHRINQNGAQQWTTKDEPAKEGGVSAVTKTPIG